MSKKSYEKLTRDEVLKMLVAKFGKKNPVTWQEVEKFCEEKNIQFPRWLMNREISVGRNQYHLGKYSASAKHSGPEIAPATSKAEPFIPEAVVAQAAVVDLAEARKNSLKSTAAGYVPKPLKGFIKFGIYDRVFAIIASGRFYPTYIAGLSGNGKTETVREVCAQIGRELIQININPATDEDDLIGGLRLVDGNTMFEDGPVLTAMRRGAILLLDETDRGSNRLMCLQSILEGRPYFVKKTGETVTPTKGFNIIATANTKGRGDANGRYSAANIIDDAWLERFPVTLLQVYPGPDIESKILKAYAKELGIDLLEATGFIKNLVFWSDTIRKTYDASGIDETITTRRLIHIMNAFSIFGSSMEAIEMCINRFDDNSRNSMLDLWTKIDPAAKPEVVAPEAVTANDDPAITF